METNMKSLKNTQKYRKTAKGVLTNMYQHMKRKYKVLFTLEEFHGRFLRDSKFLYLVSEWKKNKFDKQDKPSRDRKDCRKPYTVENTQMLTWAENRFKASALDGKLGRKPPVLQLMGGKVIKRFLSQRHVVKELGLSQGDLSMVLNGKRKTVSGYRFVYEDSNLLKESK